jgi:hypothetical protein
VRALRLIGLDADGRSVICEDVDGSQQYRLPADEQLRAAARGDLTRLGQIEIELEAQLRPKDIQARIRAGATVEQVAAAAGIPAQRVERYAHPVLLERSRAAEIAQGGHPLRADGPALETLLQVVSQAFVVRGQDLDHARWDAWRGEDGRWVVQLLWRTGRSDNRAHWRFQPGAHGGTITALDDHATELVDPDPTRPLRTVAPLTQLTAAPEQVELAAETEPAPEPVVETVVDAEVEVLLTVPTVTEPTVTEPPATEPPAAQGSQHRAPKGRPSMPSWEDVLLGVRSQRG